MDMVYTIRISVMLAAVFGDEGVQYVSVRKEKF